MVSRVDLKGHGLLKATQSMHFLDAVTAVQHFNRSVHPMCTDETHMEDEVGNLQKLITTAA